MVSSASIFDGASRETAPQAFPSVTTAYGPRNNSGSRGLVLLLMVHLRTPREGCPYGIECIKKQKKNEHPKVFVFRCSAMLDFRPHPYRMRPETKGLSHGLKNSPPDCFSPRLRRGRPFESHPAYKKNRYPGWDNGFSGTPEGTRTPDLLIRSQSLYPTELPAHVQSRLPAYNNMGILKCQALFFKFLKNFFSVDRGWSAW